MKKHFTFYLIFLFTTLIGQIKSTQIRIQKPLDQDTINYDNLLFLKGYNCNKMTEGKTKVIPIAFRGHCILIDSIDTNYTKNLLIGKNNTVKITDTITDIYWYLQRNYQFLGGHAMGKLSLNKKTNLITIDKLRNSINSKEHPLTLRFKVIKLTLYEMILEDLEPNLGHRRYHFLFKVN